MEYSSYRIYPYPYQTITTDNDYKETYAHDIEHYTNLTKYIPKLKSKSKTLEIGVGYGFNAVILRRLFDYDVYATEHPSRKSLKNKTFLRKIRRERIHLKPMDILKKFTYKDNTFNFVIFSEILEHLAPTPDIIRHIFSEINRILKKGGYILVTTPNAATLNARWRGLRGKMIQPFPLQDMSDKTYEHIRVYTLEELERMLKLFNFDIIKKGYGNSYKGKFLSDLRRKIIFSIFPFLGTDLLVLAKKRIKI